MGIVYRPIELSNIENHVDVVGIIDTGADETIISMAIAARLGCEFDGESEAATVTSETVMLKTTRVRVFDRWAKVKADLLVGVTDRFFEIDEGIDVILGVDFLQRTHYRLSF